MSFNRISATEFFLSFFVLLNCFSNAQINPVSPNWVNEIGVNSLPTVNKNQIKDGYYYLLVDEQFNAVKAQKYFHYACSAITEEALTNVSQIEIEYDPSYQKVELHKVIVHRAGISQNRTKALELKVLNEENQRSSGILNGTKTLYANLSDIRKGDIVEYGYSIYGSNPIMKNYFNYNLSISYSVPVGKIYRRLLFNKGTKPNMVYKNTNIQPEIRETQYTEYIWNIDNPPIVSKESSTPSWYSPYGSVEISNLASWEEVKTHCMSFFKLPAYNTKNLNEIKDSILKLNNDVEKQITAAVEFAQTHIRYSGNENGIYSHIPRTPDVVIKNRYGDCKEKTVLLNELLKGLNIKAFPVLINTYMGKKLQNGVPAINAFDHVISAFLYNGQLFYIDPTISYQRGSFKKRTIPNYEIGMVLSDEISTFADISVNLQESSNVVEDFYIEKSGDTKLTVKSVYMGSAADNARYEFLVNSIDDIQESYKKFYTKYTEQVFVADSLRYEDDSEENIFIIYESYLLPKFWTAEKPEESKRITKKFLPYSLNARLNYGEEAERKDPLHIRFPMSYSQTMTVTKEGGWNIDNEIKKENNPFFDYSFEQKTEGDKLNLIYDYISKTDVVMPEDYKNYKTKMDFINYNMVFEATQNPLAEGTIGFNWALVLSLLTGISAGTILVWNIRNSKRTFSAVYEKRYDSIGGWLVLVGISLALAPLGLVATMVREYYTEMNVNYVTFFLDEQSPYFAPLKGYYNLAMPMFNCFFLIFAVYILILFSKRRNTFRFYYTVFRIANTIFIIINVIVLYNIYGNSTDISEREILSKQTTTMVRLIIGTLIWVPYVWYSERSKHTFVRESDNNNLETISSAKENTLD